MKDKNRYGVTRSTGFFIQIIAVAIVIILLLLLWPTQKSIQLSFDHQSCYIDSTSFDLKWLHSVEKQWWIESYRIEGDHLLLTDTYLQTFGAGTPSTEAVDNNNRPEYAGYVRYRINTVLPFLDWMVSSNIKATIIVNNIKADSHYPKPDRQLRVFNWVGDYTNIHIAPKRISLWTRLAKESCYDHNAF